MYRLILIIIFITLFFPVLVSAQSGAAAPAAPGASGPPSYDLNIPLGGLTKIDTSGGNILGEYFSIWYNFLTGAVGIIATAMIMYGGFKWITSRGGGQVGQAKEIISSALLGLVLALLSWVILNTLNPALVNIGLPEMSSISGGGEMQKPDISYGGIGGSGDWGPSDGAANISRPGDPVKEAAVRQNLNSHNISVNDDANPGSRTSVDRMTEQTQNQLINMQEASGCGMMVTGGNEHGNDAHQGGQAADLRTDNGGCLDTYIMSNNFLSDRQTVGQTNYDGNGPYDIYTGTYNGQPVRIIDERSKPGASHWHIEFL